MVWADYSHCSLLDIFGWEPKEHCSTMFHWEPEGRYCHKLCQAIAPFWFSMEYRWTALMPFWLSTDDKCVCCILAHIHGVLLKTYNQDKQVCGKETSSPMLIPKSHTPTLFHRMQIARDKRASEQSLELVPNFKVCACQLNPPYRAFSCDMMLSSNMAASI